MVLATGLCGPTPVLGVHGIATYAQFFMLKKLVFISVPNFHGPTSRSGPVLRTMIVILLTFGVFIIYTTPFTFKIK